MAFMLVPFVLAILRRVKAPHFDADDGDTRCYGSPLEDAVVFNPSYAISWPCGCGVSYVVQLSQDRSSCYT